jgi:hypothetical protein
MKCVPALLTVVALMACCALARPAAAQTASHQALKPKSAQGHKARMRHDQLTLYPHGKPTRPQKAYSAFPHRFDHPTPIHNTFMGVRR